MNMRRLGRDPVMGDVVRHRLEALVAEIAPQRAVALLDEPGAGEPSTPSPWASYAAPDEPVPPPADGQAEPVAPRRARPGWSATVVRRGWEFGRAHLAVVAILGLVAVGWAVVGMSQARTVPVATAVPVASASPAPTPTPELIQVHVVGAVARPGVVRLPVGSRVADAVDAAGGATDAARLGDLNLAAVVADGAQVVVGSPERASEVRGAGGDGAARAGGPAGAAQVNLNTATVEQLDGLPGVGPVTAERIIAWRTQHQRFTRVEELQEVDGIGAKTFAQLRPYVRV